MTEPGSANDNTKSRRVRDGLSRKWSDVNIGEITTDETLKRLADARNSASTSANRFMLFGALGAFLYLLRLERIANDVKIGDYSLANLPFGLFVVSSTALVLATVALIRFGDARGFDRQLRLACEQRHPVGCHAHYSNFPNSNAFGESFSLMARVVEAGSIMSLLRAFSLFLISLFILLLVVAPLFAGTDYLINDRYLKEGSYENVRFWLVCTLAVTNLLTLLLVLWTRFVDEG